MKKIIILLIVIMLFIVSCSPAEETPESTNQEISWAWKLATDAEDAHNFINGLGAYDKPHALGSITVNDRGFYIFYRGDIAGTSDWEWKLADNDDDAYNFLNGIGVYNTPVREAHVLGSSGAGFYIFFRK
ncbi:hypothetical protein ACFL6I_23845 [candidate division KSB1 bacterium]